MQNTDRDFRLAAKSYKKSDESRWVFAFSASRIVGKNEDFATKRLADSLGISPDSVEDHAHAFWMFDKLRKMGDGAERLYVQTARKLPYIHYSHFRALYDLRISRNLSDEQIMSLLIDIVQSEGGISSRNLEDHVHSKYGDTRTWEFYGRKALKELTKTTSHPGIPTTSEEIGTLYAVVLNSNGLNIQYFVVAYSPVAAEKVARKDMEKLSDEETAKSAKLNAINEIETVLASSTHILNVTSSWLGDNA
jgi:hypothetical protein